MRSDCSDLRKCMVVYGFPYVAPYVCAGVYLEKGTQPYTRSLLDGPNRTVLASHRRALLERRFCVEASLSRCRTVGDVWEINERLDAIDAALEATDRTETT